MSPDRIVPSLDRLNDLLLEEQELRRQDIRERRKDRASQRWKNVLGLILIAAVALVVVDNRVDGANDRKERDRREAQAEVELTGRLCAAWQNRIEDHATLTDFLAERVGTDEGDVFVADLVVAYAKSDAAYARERDLTEKRCQ